MIRNAQATKRALEAKVRRLKSLVRTELVPLDGGRYRTADYHTPHEYSRFSDWRELEAGTFFPGETTAFVEVPISSGLMPR